MKQFISKIISNEKIAKEQYSMVLDAAAMGEKVAPGQFVHVRCGHDADPLLRRPFSIYKMKDAGGQRAMELIYKIVGRGTALLARKTPGESIDVLGPLGNGFDINNPSVAYIVVGGIGAASCYMLAEELIKKKCKVYYFFGARSKDYIICEEDFRALGCESHICTDDGSCGHKKLIPDHLTDILKEIPKAELSTAEIYACGPMVMLKRVAEVAEKAKIRCQMSLEARMGCGVGACMSCVVKCKQGDSFIYKRVCKYGPVLKASEIIWE